MLHVFYRGAVAAQTTQPQQQQQSHLLDLLDVNISTGGATAGWVDPWGTPAHPSEPPAPAMPPRPKVRSIILSVSLRYRFFTFVVGYFLGCNFNSLLGPIILLDQSISLSRSTLYSPKPQS